MDRFFYSGHQVLTATESQTKCLRKNIERFILNDEACWPHTFSIVLVGCTNVTGDIPRTIFPQTGESLSTERLFSIANTFFSEAGYACSIDAKAGQFRCSRALRDLYIHQTTAEMAIYPGDDQDNTHRIIATRWDEGMIPGELISNTYANDDVEAFCAYLASEKVALCRDYEGGGVCVVAGRLVARHIAVVWRDFSE